MKEREEENSWILGKNWHRKNIERMIADKASKKITNKNLEKKNVNKNFWGEEIEFKIDKKNKAKLRKKISKTDINAPKRVKKSRSTK